MIWRHLKTGGAYRIVGYTIIEATLTPAVIYQNAHGASFVRPCAEFFDGRFRQEPVARPVPPAGSFTKDELNA